MMFAIGGILLLLGVVCAIASLVFFVMVVIEMFKRDEQTIGIVCVILTFVTGFGPIIAFIYGWTKATLWDIKKTMTYWTMTLVGQIVFLGLGMVILISGAAMMEPNEFNMDPDSMDFEIDFDGSDIDMGEGGFGMEDGSGAGAGSGFGSDGFGAEATPTPDQ